MSRILIISLLLLAFSTRVHAQAPVFSQYYSTGLYLNPALSGTHNNIYFGMNYRTQWSSVNMPFKTFQFSYIHPLMQQGPRVKHIGGIGLSFFNDVAGANEEFKATGINLAGSYNLHLNSYGNNVISMGMQVGLNQMQYNSGFFQWGSQYNPDRGFDESQEGEFSGINQRHFYPAVNVGMVWSYRNKQRYVLKNFSSYTGISITNVNRPDEAVIGNEKQPLPLLYTLHGGFKIFLDEEFSVSPNYLINLQNGVFQTNVGGYLNYLLTNPYQHDEQITISFGTWYRLKDSFIFAAGFQSSRFNVGFSYDMNTSSLGRFMGSTGAYEFSLAMKILRQHNIRRFSTPMI